MGMLTDRRRNGFFDMLVVLFLLSEMAFFALPFVPSVVYELCTFSRKGISCILVFVMIVYCEVLEFKNPTCKRDDSGMVKATVLISAATLIILLASLIIYEQSPLSALKAYYYYFELLAVLPLTYYFLNHSGFEFFCKIFMVFGFSLSVLVIMQGYLSGHGIYILDGDVIEMSVKFSQTRMMAQSTVNALTVLIGFGVCFSERFSKRFRVFCFIAVLIAMWAIFAVVITRVMEFALVVTLVLLFVVWPKDVRVKLGLIACVIVVAVAARASISGFAESFGETPQGTAVRLYGWSYYAQSIVKNIFFGIGYIAPDADCYTDIALGGGAFYPSDLGVMKYFGILGIPGVIYVVFIACQLAKKLSCLRRRRSDLYPLCFLLFFYFLFSSVSLGFCDTVRIVYLPTMMSIFIFATDLERASAGNAIERAEC